GLKRVLLKKDALILLADPPAWTTGASCCVQCEQTRSEQGRTSMSTMMNLFESMNQERTILLDAIMTLPEGLLVLQPHFCGTMRGKQGEGGREGRVSLNRRAAPVGRRFRRSAKAFRALL